MSLRFPIFAACVALAGPVAIKAQTVLAADSPFMPPGAGPGDVRSAEANPFELAGASVTSNGTEVCIYDAGEKRSHWIPVGSAEGRIKVLGYDSVRDRAEVRIDGIAQVLELRKDTVLASALPAQLPMPGNISMPSVFGNRVPQPAYGSPQMLERARKEREARMFVTDLMEIGARQRQADEEARDKKAQENGK